MGLSVVAFVALVVSTAATVAEDIADARAAIASLIEDDQTLAPKFLRLGFHDSVGGVDGCVDMNDDENFGLEIPIAALEALPTYDALSRADVWALAALVGAYESQEEPRARAFPLEHFRRVNCEDAAECRSASCGPRDGPPRFIPNGNLHTPKLLQFFREEYGFDARETVAIMGAHSIGSLARENSGFDGEKGWVMNNKVLDNSYHRMLVGPNGEVYGGRDWTQKVVDNSALRVDDDDPESLPRDRAQWEHISTTGPCADKPEGVCEKRIMINADMALVRDFSSMALMDRPSGRVFCDFGCEASAFDDDADDMELCDDAVDDAGSPSVCPFATATLSIVQGYATDRDAFLEDFEAVLLRMVAHGYDAPACPEPPCDIGARTGEGGAATSVAARGAVPALFLSLLGFFLAPDETAAALVVGSVVVGSLAGWALQGPGLSSGSTKFVECLGDVAVVSGVAAMAVGAFLAVAVAALLACRRAIFA